MMLVAPGPSSVLLQYWTKCGSEVFASAHCLLWMKRRLLIQKNNEQIVRSVIYQQIRKTFIIKLHVPKNAMSSLHHILDLKQPWTLLYVLVFWSEARILAYEGAITELS